MDDAPSQTKPRRLALAPDVAESDVAESTAADDGGAFTESGQVLLWHVTVTFAGPRRPRQQLHAALVRLVEAQPFPATVRYNDERAEISYWDEAEDVDDAAALGLRLWAEHRRTADLPGWRAVGIEVVDRATLRARGDRTPPPAALGDVRPW
ncbi:hypothetical protein SAMN06264364_10955 [Quadrisphaera granulorum]|uniref:Uncharacterized protein n=1 Tax=Quadrisphaera granulorum TaxID=317664 RepID=A0A316AAU4_9ACTN|nr:hypothetical protein [Quadrisphaera granulorum]PWJ53974.1 hypothetical protein BXY45_10955 [Quadrisphaera granulorum]SZE96431.1 hypothetical protein SAMN06264364_10955 [Quadrisphaera granulorum]